MQICKRICTCCLKTEVTKHQKRQKVGKDLRNLHLNNNVSVACSEWRRLIYGNQTNSDDSE